MGSYKNSKQQKDSKLFVNKNSIWDKFQIGVKNHTSHQKRLCDLFVEKILNIKNSTSYLT